MGLFSIFRKNKQQPSSEQSAYHSRAEEDSSTVRASRKRKTAGNQVNDAVDPVLPEKKRARRRLVGAVALVLAVVIVLPMVLDSEPKPLADDIAIQIPGRDKPASTSASATAASASTSNVSGLDQQEEIIDPASTPVSPSANPKPGVANLAAPSAAPVAPLTANTNVDVPSAPQVEQEAKPEPKPVAKPKPENKPKVEIKQEIKQERKPKPESKLEAKAEEKPDVIEPQDDAERAVAILNGRGDAAVARPAEKKAGKFVIQVAALASQEKVDELRGKLSDAGIHSYTQTIKTSSGERIRIRVGPFASKEEAEKARARLASLGLSGSLVPA